MVPNNSIRILSVGMKYLEGLGIDVNKLGDVGLEVRYRSLYGEEFVVERNR